ncbi:hypothetical protein E2C01_044505 [Portunus trituberculatus]|uniref:Uncharacterized protein n=1 Tax=Portunus trituberculatus TaxID=210409 RepID=A0A5B7FYM1_PORTR|nr:hypothetical protein [Portunus trituberculatus]
MPWALKLRMIRQFKYQAFQNTVQRVANTTKDYKTKIDNQAVPPFPRAVKKIKDIAHRNQLMHSFYQSFAPQGLLR